MRPEVAAEVREWLERAADEASEALAVAREVYSAVLARLPVE
ncbi:MAG: hypothetical protein ACR2JY_08330 [Chloroflexota bacterium]